MTKRKHIKKQLLEFIQTMGTDGVTWKDVTDEFDVHHGSASSRLSLMHKYGEIVRLSEKRDGCKVYVLPAFIDGRPVERFQGRSVEDPDEVLVVDPTLNETQKRIAEVCDGIRDLLWRKNAQYGNSAFDPKRVFSKASPLEQILVRIDDKLSQIATTGFSAADEDTLQDLIGYLVLLKVILAQESAA